MVLGMVGWQWVYIAWGIPAVVLGVLVLIFLTDRPGQATGSNPRSARRWSWSSSARRRCTTQAGT